MNKPLFCLAIIMLLLAACRQREDLAQLNKINYTLQTANKIIQEDNKLVHEALVEKFHDPVYHSYGEIWEPRARRIKKQADSIVVFIEELKSELIKQSDSLKKEKASLIEQLYTTDGPGYTLVSRLAAFKDSFPAIIHVEDFVDNAYKHASLITDIPLAYSAVPLLPGYTDSLNAPQRRQYVMNWLADNFSGVSPAMTLVVLNRIEIDLLATTKAFMEFCLNHIDRMTCGWRGFHAVAVLNTSYVKQGQPIEVSVGLGSFSTAGNPCITIDGKEMELNNDAAVIHHFTATGKPGKHSVDVKIRYTRLDGSDEQVSKKLTYIIAEK